MKGLGAAWDRHSLKVFNCQQPGFPPQTVGCEDIKAHVSFCERMAVTSGRSLRELITVSDQCLANGGSASANDPNVNKDVGVLTHANGRATPDPAMHCDHVGAN